MNKEESLEVLSSAVYKLSFSELLKQSGIGIGNNYVAGKCTRTWFERWFCSKIGPRRKFQIRNQDRFIGFSLGAPGDGLLHLWRPADEYELLVYCKFRGVSNLPKEGLRAQGKIALKRDYWPKKATYVPVVLNGYLHHCYVDHYSGSQLYLPHIDLWVRE